MGVFLFIILAATAVGSSVAMVTHRNPVYSALFMVVTFAVTAIMFLLLGAPFIAALQIIVYAGAIVVLFLFVIMFLSVKSGALIENRRGPLLSALVLGGVVAGELAAVVASGTRAGVFQPATPDGFGSVESVAGLLFTRYLIPFEITSVLLVVGMVGAVVLARPSATGGKPRPDVGEQQPAVRGPKPEPETVAATGVDR